GGAVARVAVAVFRDVAFAARLAAELAARARRLDAEAGAIAGAGGAGEPVLAGAADRLERARRGAAVAVEVVAVVALLAGIDRAVAAFAGDTGDLDGRRAVERIARHRLDHHRLALGQIGDRKRRRERFAGVSGEEQRPGAGGLAEEADL